MKLGPYTIGPDSPPLVIAEAGINHAGSFQVALDMIEAAHKAGAHVVKFQTHTQDEFSDTPAYPTNAGGESIQDLIRRCSFTEEQETLLAVHARQTGIVYLSTPFTLAAV